MSVQIYRLKQRMMSIGRKGSVTGTIRSRNRTRRGVDQLEAYMQTNEYIEEVAKSKLGLAYANEIILKNVKSRSCRWCGLFVC